MTETEKEEFDRRQKELDIQLNDPVLMKQAQEAMDKIAQKIAFGLGGKIIIMNNGKTYLEGKEKK